MFCALVHKQCNDRLYTWHFSFRKNLFRNDELSNARMIPKGENLLEKYRI